MKFLSLTIIALLMSVASFAIGVITGPSSLCVGTNVTLTDTPSGGTWSSSDLTVAAVGSASGIVTGISAGVVNITYTVGASSATATLTVYPMPATITGTTSVCTGSSSALADATPGGTWSSSATGVAVIGSTSGTVSGMSVGFAYITYTLPTGCSTTTSVYVSPSPTAIAGSSSVCEGSTTTLTDATTGGTWSSSTTSVATVGTGGTVTGIVAGTATIAYTLGSGCSTTRTITVNPAVPPLSGPSSICVGTCATETTAISGCIWSSSSMSIATIGSSTGFACGVTAGTITITCLAPTGCIATKTITVNPLPAAITGASTLCVGTCASQTDASGGGTWSSANPAIATIGSVSGTACGISLGNTTITYTLPTGCTATKTISVAAAPAPISGPGSLCVGACVTLTDATTGGTWSSASSIIAVGSATGSVCGLSVGIATVTYSLGTGCNTTKTMTVSASPSAISGPSTICMGSSITLTDAVSGGTWSSSDPSVASAGSLGGITGVSVGTAVITYTLGSCSATKSITVNAIPAVYSVSGGGVYCAGGSGVDISMTPSEAGIRYQLYSGATAIDSPITGTGGLVDFGLITTVGIYSILATNPTTSCAVAMAGSASVDVNPLPAVYSISGSGSYCAGSAGSDITLTGSEFGVSYSLYLSGSSVGSPVTGSGSALDFGYHTAGSYSIVATDISTGCTAAMTGTATVTAAPLPTRYAVTGGGSFCAGSAGVHVGLSSSQVGVSYQVHLGGVTHSPVSGSGGSIDFGLFMTTGTAMVTAVNATTGCTDTMSGTVTLDTIAAPAPISGATTVCAGSSTTLTDATTGGTWSSSSTGIATIGAGTGTVAGISSGTTIITYTIGTTCVRTATITVNPTPVIYTVTGGGSYCSGGSGVPIGLSGSVIGINYQLYRSGTSVGSAVAGTGSALSFGLQTVTGSYTAIATNAVTGCTGNMAGTASVGITAPPPSYTVTGGGSFCSGGAGVHIYLSGSTTGVTYQLFNGSSVVSTIAGTGSPIDWGAHTTAGTYTVLGTSGSTSCSGTMTGSATISVTSLVTPAVSVVAEDTVCSGATATYTAAPVNGGSSPTFAWSVNGTVAATTSTYSYSPVNGDIVSVFMTSSAACVTTSAASDSISMTVITPGPIVGSTSACIGAVLSLSDTATGGTWSSSDPSIATIATVGASTGVVTGLTVGSAVMTYTMVAGCFVTTTVTVSAPPTISASSSAASCGELYTLTATGGTSYAWAPSSGLSCATCATTAADPSATTIYTVTGTNSSGCSNTASVSVNGNRILGHISFSGTMPDTLDLKVWLIQFNATDSSLAALDSFYTCLSSSTPYYEFDSKSPGNYMVKAQLLHGNPVGSSGYIPTYGYSSAHWDSAITITHAAGTDTMHIHMQRGTVPPGPGFIGGLISAGAGRGVSGEAPVEGMLVYLKDATTGLVLTYTYTDVNGRYSFSDIAYGSYIIYPEAYNFYTTPSSAVTLSTSMPSVNDINFRQSLTYHTIRPYTTAITAITSGAELRIFPNPATEHINIEWNNQTSEQAMITLTDITGRQVYSKQLNMNAGAGNTQLNIAGITAGNYVLSIKADHIFYIGKLVIE